MALRKQESRSSISSGRPPLWLLAVLLVVIQVGFGGYGIVLQQFAKVPLLVD